MTNTEENCEGVVPKGVIEGMHLAAVEGDVLLRVVGGGRPSGEALSDGLLHVRRVVFRQRAALFPEAGVAWERTLRSIDYVRKIETRWNNFIGIENTFQ